MDTPRRLGLVGLCLFALTVPGCMSPYPYQHYPTHPGGYYGQPQYMPPASSTPFPGNVELNAPTPVDPPASGSNGGSSSSGGSSSGGGYGDAPMFQPDAKKVPNYTAPGDLSPAPKNTEKPMFDKDDKTTFESDQNPFGSLDRVPENRSVSYDEKASAKPPIVRLSAEVPRETSAASEEEFFTADFEQPVTKAADEPLAVPFDEDNPLSPFVHDDETFRYLRGIVAFDDLSKTWTIIYDDQPARDDEYGGVFTLADDSRLAVLNDNDVVHVEGRISESEQDEFGKPKYSVEHLSKLKPASRSR